MVPFRTYQDWCTCMRRMIEALSVYRIYKWLPNFGMHIYGFQSKISMRLPFIGRSLANKRVLESFPCRIAKYSCQIPAESNRMKLSHVPLWKNGNWAFPVRYWNARLLAHCYYEFVGLCGSYSSNEKSGTKYVEGNAQRTPSLLFSFPAALQVQDLTLDLVELCNTAVVLRDQLFVLVASLSLKALWRTISEIRRDLHLQIEYVSNF